MIKTFFFIKSFFVLHIVVATVVLAASNTVSIREDDQYRYIQSNGIPNHQTGSFPGAGNPNSIREQQHSFRVSLNPQLAGRVMQNPQGKFGVALNGVPFDPATAEYYNNDRSSGWNIDALSGKVNLGIDMNNAHVQPNGTYHYHGVPKALSARGAMIGYAADDFSIYYIQGKRSSYRLKSGIRPSGPGGRYDGTYVQDYEYVAGLGDLDECNGVTQSTAEYPDGTYLYVLTDEFPFVPRCWKGTPDASFTQRARGGGGDQNRMRQQGPGSMGRESSDGDRGRRQPPPEAQRACSGKSTGSSCSFQAPHGTVSGQCANIGGTLACRPEGGRRGPGR